MGIDTGVRRVACIIEEVDAGQLFSKADHIRVRSQILVDTSLFERGTPELLQGGRPMQPHNKRNLAGAARFPELHLHQVGPLNGKRIVRVRDRGRQDGRRATNFGRDVLRVGVFCFVHGSSQ